MTRYSSLLLPFLLTLAPLSAADPEFILKEDIIYGRKWGTALTLDVFSPKTSSNRRGVILVLSGGWFSAKGVLGPPFMRDLLDRGYTIFAVVHGSQPKYTIPEAVDDMHRAARYIRHHARDYDIDPDRIGVYGGSAGGHLSLMLGLAGKPGDPAAKDPVDRHSSQVQAVACFYPPTDFLNFGETGRIVVGKGVLPGFRAPFDFQEFDSQTKAFLPVTDEIKILDIGKQISPAYHVDPADAPTLIIHGDADKLVPVQQSQLLMVKLEESKVPHELVIREKADHGWKDLDQDISLFADWFDKHLQPESSSP